MLGRKSLAQLAQLALTLCLAACATAPVNPDGDEAPVDLGQVTSSSVRIERKGRGPAIAHIERDCDVGEVQRVIELLGSRGAGRVKLRIDGGAEAEVVSRLPGGKGRWLVVALTDAGFTVFTSSTENLGLGRKAWLPGQGEGQTVPLREGKPDWERLTSLLKALAAREKPTGTSVAAPAKGPAWPAIEALQQLRLALPDTSRRFLLAI